MTLALTAGMVPTMLGILTSWSKYLKVKLYKTCFWGKEGGLEYTEEVKMSIKAV